MCQMFSDMERLGPMMARVAVRLAPSAQKTRPAHVTTLCSETQILGVWVSWAETLLVIQDNAPFAELLGFGRETVCYVCYASSWCPIVDLFADLCPYGQGNLVYLF